MAEIGAEIKSFQDTLQESVVNPIKSLFLVKAEVGCWQLFMFSEIDRVSKKKEVFKYATSWDTASLIIAEDIRKNLAYTIQQGFCCYLIVKVQERDRMPIFKRLRIVFLEQ